MRRLLVIVVCGGALAGASSACDVGLPAGQEPHHEFNFLDMADQPKVKPQRAVPHRLEPPAGAVASPAGAAGSAISTAAAAPPSPSGMNRRKVISSAAASTASAGQS